MSMNAEDRKPYPRHLLAKPRATALVPSKNVLASFSERDEVADLLIDISYDLEVFAKSIPKWLNSWLIHFLLTGSSPLHIQCITLKKIKSGALTEHFVYLMEQTNEKIPAIFLTWGLYFSKVTVPF